MKEFHEIRKVGRTRRNEVRSQEYHGITKEFLYGDEDKHFMKYVSMEFDNAGRLTIYQGLAEDNGDMGCLQIHFNPDETEFIMNTIRDFNAEAEFSKFDEDLKQQLEQ